ncbi:DUF1573 domain-containing protein [Parvicella tangerina]|uniref:DUF1573 domain-containing protein n=1 Tax=Parvicella tangerina TaxID=2829795 RepID=A0A916JN84_9FLAO|nr:DUF1573 domain-containing protein [Parvicella tangerina]CAG5083231.1 hypothetical protein CRYO30217_02130 [Parvicella tangerina]
MKKLFIGILSLAMITSCTFSDQGNNGDEITVEDIDPENPPVITFDNPDFDFGEVAVGAVVEHEFKFTNTGTGNLIIHDAKPSCGCTALKNWPKGAIKPGEGGSIPIEFTPSHSGEVTKTVSVITNCSPSVLKLQIKGNVIGG